MESKTCKANDRNGEGRQKEGMTYTFFYRLIMKIAHYYHWHYAPSIYPDGDTQLWCNGVFNGLALKEQIDIGYPRNN